MKIDVVYKLAQGSKFDDSELRYSLRSLSNFKDLGNVFIVGYKPRWVQEIIHIPAEDLHPANKDCNLINKLILACYHPDLSNQFLNFSDDQFLLKEVSINDFIDPYYDNSLLNEEVLKKRNRWKRRVFNTTEALKKLNLPFNCYEAHIPTLLSKEEYPRIMSQYNYSDVPGMCGNTLYFNTIKYKGKEINKEYSLKMEVAQVSLDKVEAICNGKTQLNISENATNEYIFLYLSKIFPSKSKFEIF